MEPADEETEPKKLSEKPKKLSDIVKENMFQDFIINNDAVTESEEPNKLLGNKSTMYFDNNKFILFEDVLENEDILKTYLSKSNNANNENEDFKKEISDEIKKPEETYFNSHNLYASKKVYNSKPKVLSEEDIDRIRGVHLLKLLPSDNSVNLELNNDSLCPIKENKISLVSSDLTLSTPKKSIALSLKELSSSLKPKSLSSVASSYRSNNSDNYTLKNQSSKSSIASQPNALSKVKKNSIADPKGAPEKCFKVESLSRKRNCRPNNTLFGNKSFKNPKVVHCAESEVEAMDTEGLKKGFKGTKATTLKRAKLKYSGSNDQIKKELRVELTDILINSEFKNLLKNKKRFSSDGSLMFDTVTESPSNNSKSKVSEKEDESFPTESKKRKSLTGCPAIKNSKKVKRELNVKESDLNQSLDCIETHESVLQKTNSDDLNSDKNNNENETVTNNSQILGVNQSNIVSKASNKSPVRSISKRSKSVKTNFSTQKSDLESSSITHENTLGKTSCKQSISGESKSPGPILNGNNNLHVNKFKTVRKNCQKENNELNFLRNNNITVTVLKNPQQNNLEGSSTLDKSSCTSASQEQKPSAFMQLFSKFTESKSEHSEVKKFSSEENFISFLSGSCKMLPKSPQSERPSNEKPPSDSRGLFIPKKIYSQLSSEDDIGSPDLKATNEDRFIHKNKLSQSVNSPENSHCKLSFKKNNNISLLSSSNCVGTSTGVNDHLDRENVVVDEIESKSCGGKPVVESEKRKRNKSLFKSTANKINISAQQTNSTELSPANTDNSSISRNKRKFPLNTDNDSEFAVKNNKRAFSPENAICENVLDRDNSSVTDLCALEAELMLSDFSEANGPSFIKTHSGRKRSLGKSKVSALQSPNSQIFSENDQLSKTKAKKKPSTKFEKLTCNSSSKDVKHVNSTAPVISSVKMSDNNIGMLHVDSIKEELLQPNLSSDHSDTDVQFIDPMKARKKNFVKNIAKSQVLEHSSFVSNYLSSPSTSPDKPLNKNVSKMGRNLKKYSIDNKSPIEKRKDSLSHSSYSSNRTVRSDIDDKLQSNSPVKVSNSKLSEGKYSSESSICNSPSPKKKVKSKKSILNSKDPVSSSVKMPDNNIHMSFVDGVEQELPQPNLSSDHSNTDVSFMDPMKSRKKKKFVKNSAKSKVLEHSSFVSNYLSSQTTSAGMPLNKKISKMGKNFKKYSIDNKSPIKTGKNSLLQSSYSSNRIVKSDIDDELQNNSPFEVNNTKFSEEKCSESSICSSPSPKQKVKSKKSSLNSKAPVIASVKMLDNNIHMSCIDGIEGIEEELPQPDLSSDHSNADVPFIDPMKARKKKKSIKSISKSHVLEHSSCVSNSLPSPSTSARKPLNKRISKMGKNLKAYSINNKSAIKKRKDSLSQSLYSLNRTLKSDIDYELQNNSVKVSNTKFSDGKYSSEGSICNSPSRKQKVKSKKCILNSEDTELATKGFILDKEALSNTYQSNFTSKAEKDIPVQSSYGEHSPRKSVRLKKKAERLSQLSMSPDPSDQTFESDSPNSVHKLVKTDPSPKKISANKSSVSFNLNQPLSSTPSTSHQNTSSNNNFLQYDSNQFIRVHSDCFYHPQTNRYFISLAQHPLIVNQSNVSNMNQFNSCQVPQIQMSFQPQNFPNLMTPLNSSASQNFLHPVYQPNFLPQLSNFQYNNSFGTRVNNLPGLQPVSNGVSCSGNQIFNTSQMGLNMPNIVHINTPTSTINPAARTINTQERVVLENLKQTATQSSKRHVVSCPTNNNVSNSVSLNADSCSGNQSFISKRRNTTQMGLNMPNIVDVNTATSSTNSAPRSVKTRETLIVESIISTTRKGKQRAVNYPQNNNVLSHPVSLNQNRNIRENNASNYPSQNFKSDGNKRKKGKLHSVDHKNKQTQELFPSGNRYKFLPDIVNRTIVWNNVVHNVIELNCLRRMVIFSSSVFGDITFNEFIRVKAFYSNAGNLNLLKTIISEDMSTYDISCQVKYKFHKSLFNVPMRQILKDYVFFHVNHLCEATDIKELIDLVYQKFSLKECLILSKIVPKGIRYVCKGTLVKYFTFVAMFRLFDECKRRNQLK